MNDAELVPIDVRVLDDVATALRQLTRFTNGVKRDRPFRYVPHRAWVYREPVSFEPADSGLIETTQRIGIEVCFPVSVDHHGESDVEAVGAAIIAELEWAVFQDPSRGVDGDTRLVAHNAHLIPSREHDGAPLARAVMLIEAIYHRGFGNPYTREAQTR